MYLHFITWLTPYPDLFVHQLTFQCSIKTFVLKHHLISLDTILRLWQDVKKGDLIRSWSNSSLIWFNFQVPIAIYDLGNVIRSLSIICFSFQSFLSICAFNSATLQYYIEINQTFGILLRETFFFQLCFQ